MQTRYAQFFTLFVLAVGFLMLTGQTEPPPPPHTPYPTPSPIPDSTPLLGCRCTYVNLAYTKYDAFWGPDGDGKKAWPHGKGTSYPYLDGKTLGSVFHNPDNKLLPGSRSIGMAFEFQCTVAGTQKLCKEMQLVRSTQVTKNGTTSAKWTGRSFDPDGSGQHTVDVSSQAKCASNGGTWDAASGGCTLRAGFAGTGKWVPDGGSVGAEPAYTEPFAYKTHPDHKIVWFDAPLTYGKEKYASFLAWVRGTDRKYCYVLFDVRLERMYKYKKLWITEEVVVYDQRVGADTLPLNR